VADHARLVWLLDDLTPQQQEILFLTVSGFTAAEAATCSE
jgi:DNA-binding CsgD family transcriptional regulator